MVALVTVAMAVVVLDTITCTCIFVIFLIAPIIVSIILYYFVMKVERNTQPLANNAREYMQFFYE